MNEPNEHGTANVETLSTVFGTVKEKWGELPKSSLIFGNGVI